MTTDNAYGEGWRARKALGPGSYPIGDNPYWIAGLDLDNAEDPQVQALNAWFQGWNDRDAAY